MNGLKFVFAVAVVAITASGVVGRPPADLREQVERIAERKPKGLMFSVAISGDGKLLATAHSSVCVWRLSDGERVAEIVADRSAAALAFTADAASLLILYADCDGFVRYTLATNAKTALLGHVPAETGGGPFRPSQHSWDGPRILVGPRGDVLVTQQLRLRSLSLADAAAEPVDLRLNTEDEWWKNHCRVLTPPSGRWKPHAGVDGDLRAVDGRRLADAPLPNPQRVRLRCGALLPKLDWLVAGGEGGRLIAWPSPTATPTAAVTVCDAPTSDGDLHYMVAHPTRPVVYCMSRSGCVGYDFDVKRPLRHPEMPPKFTGGLLLDPTGEFVITYGGLFGCWKTAEFVPVVGTP